MLDNNAVKRAAAKNETQRKLRVFIANGRVEKLKSACFHEMRKIMKSTKSTQRLSAHSARFSLLIAATALSVVLLTLFGMVRPAQAQSDDVPTTTDIAIKRMQIDEQYDRARLAAMEANRMQIAARAQYETNAPVAAPVAALHYSQPAPVYRQPVSGQKQDSPSSGGFGWLIGAGVVVWIWRACTKK